MQDAREQTNAYFPETTFGQGPADWDADPGVVEMLTIEPQTAGLRRTYVENRGIRRRGLAPHRKLPALRSEAQFSFGIYASGSSVVTANDSAAATFALVEMLRNALCGRHLGYASAIVSGSTTAPEITVGQGANHPAGGFIFGVNAATGAGEFLCVDSVAGDVLTLRTEATAAVDSAVGSAIAVFPNSRGLFNRAHPSHITHSLFFRGEDVDDNLEARGCKLNLTGIENTEPGGDASFSFGGMAATFSSASLTKPSLTGAPQGPAGPIVGRSGTAVRIANHGTAAMADVGAYSWSFNPGITSKKVMGTSTSAVEGVLGYHADIADTTLTVHVPYDDAWITDIRNGQLKHLMIQVGDQRGDAYGIYLPRAELIEDPERGEQAGETSMALTFRALEYEGSTHTEGSDNYELERARFALLFAA